MLVTANGFCVLLRALDLTQGLSKPTPNTYQAPSVPPSPSGVSGSADTQSKLASTQILDQVDSCDVEPYTPTPLEQIFPPFDQEKANVYRYRQQQSVNLGSWFVQETWMTPSLFTCASGSKKSELDIASGWGSTSNARAVLERHWDTFINQSDFEYLANIGINTVRLPIGYWSLGPSFCEDTPFAGVADVYRNSWSRVLRAINMASAAGIGVLVDLHGAVGSQNGQPHSGISDGRTNLFNTPAHMDKTIDVLCYLVQHLVYVTNVVGIQILNEPQNVPELPDFYNRAIASMRQVSLAAAGFPLYLHDGFDLERFSHYVAERKDFVVQDHHSYFVFTPSDEAEPASQHTSDVTSTVSSSLSNASAQQHRNLVVDEWSCALTPESLSKETDQHQARKAFCTGQMEVYANTTAGWSFWSYQKEACDNDPGWCFKAAVGNSLPSSFFSYGEMVATNPSQLQSVTTGMTVPTTSDILSRAQGSSSTDEALSWNCQISGYRRRLAATRMRRQSDSSSTVSYDGIDMTTAQRSIAKGYADGFLAAKTFATYGMSKLGFIEQYVTDGIAALGPGVVVDGTEQDYKTWFVKGLEDGERIIAAAANP